MYAKRSHIILFVGVILISFPRLIFGQSEIEEERSSLRGLTGVGFTVNIEQNTAFADTQLVKIEAIKKQGIQQLRDRNITVYDDRKIRESVRTPVLYLHINLLSTQTGIISFGVTASLYQPVKLILRDDNETTASTWETSVVGIATYDKIGVIKQAAMGVIHQFIDDYHTINSN